jgi:hypothetical protein
MELFWCNLFFWVEDLVTVASPMSSFCHLLKNLKFNIFRELKRCIFYFNICMLVNTESSGEFSHHGNEFSGSITDNVSKNVLHHWIS